MTSQMVQMTHANRFKLRDERWLENMFVIKVFIADFAESVFKTYMRNMLHLEQTFHTFFCFDQEKLAE